MQKLVGILCIMGGTALLISGYNAQHEMGAKLQYTVTKNLTQRARYQLIGGGVLCALGIFQIYAAKK